MSVAESVAEQSAVVWRPLSIGSVEIGFPVVQAALSGYSDWAMRVIARRLGAPYTLCEVMLDQFITQHGHTKKNRGRMRVTDEEHPVGGQLMGANPEDFGPAAVCVLRVRSLPRAMLPRRQAPGRRGPG